MSAEAIYEALTVDFDLARLVSKRVYVQERPQEDELPAISYELDARGAARTEGANPTRQNAWSLFCWSCDYDEALKIARRVEEVMHGYAGNCILEAVVAGGRDDYEEEIKAHARVVELAVIARGD